MTQITRATRISRLPVSSPCFLSLQPVACSTTPSSCLPLQRPYPDCRKGITSLPVGVLTLKPRNPRTTEAATRTAGPPPSSRQRRRSEPSRLRCARASCLARRASGRRSRARLWGRRVLARGGRTRRGRRVLGKMVLLEEERWRGSSRLFRRHGGSFGCQLGCHRWRFERIESRLDVRCIASYFLGKVVENDKAEGGR